MPLTFDDRKLLPPGVHEATLDEVAELFARFQRSDRRMKLMAKLREYLAALKKAGVGQAVIVDGCFVMGCVDEPDDIDVMLVHSSEWNMDALLLPYQYSLMDKKFTKKTYGLEVFSVQAGSDEEREWKSFFGNVNVKWCRLFEWPEDLCKGIVRVAL